MNGNHIKLNLTNVLIIGVSAVAFGFALNMLAKVAGNVPVLGSATKGAQTALRVSSGM